MVAKSISAKKYSNPPGPAFKTGEIVWIFQKESRTSKCSIISGTISGRKDKDLPNGGTYVVSLKATSKNKKETYQMLTRHPLVIFKTKEAAEKAFAFGVSAWMLSERGLGWEYKKILYSPSEESFSSDGLETNRYLNWNYVYLTEIGVLEAVQKRLNTLIKNNKEDMAKLHKKEKTLHAVYARVASKLSGKSVSQIITKQERKTLSALQYY